MDLSSCVVTNSKVDLAFVSPKSARAVSFEAGKAYESKLLKLPNFLVDDVTDYDESHLLDGLKLSGFFLEKFLFSEKTFDQNQQKFFYRDNIRASLEAF